MMATSAMAYRKRSLDKSDSHLECKRPRPSFFFRLESESSAGTGDDDTESVYSVQDRETDFVRDTSDTDSKSEHYEVEIEYDVASLSGSEQGDIFSPSDSSCDSDDMMLAVAAVCNQSDIENFITDAEDSDNSSLLALDDSSTGLTDFYKCLQCKSQNDNPQFRFCDKCFQDRKTFFPPRPRPRRGRSNQRKATSTPAVKLEDVQSCLSGLSQETTASSQDSGIGSSQEFNLGLDQIVVPSTSSGGDVAEATRKRKRQVSESSLSDYEENPKKLKEEKSVDESVQIRTAADDSVDDVSLGGAIPEIKEQCIICNSKPKNGIFLHGRIAHMCCCYPCAMKTWKSSKRCPICKRKVNNVVRVYIT